MSKKNKKILFGVLGLVVAVVVLALLYINFRPQPKDAGGSKTITLTVVFADESTKEFTCGSYKTIENVVLVTEKTTEMKMAICHLSIETDSDYVQFIVMSTESNKDKVISYAEGIGATLTAL